MPRFIKITSFILYVFSARIQKKTLLHVSILCYSVEALWFMLITTFATFKYS